MHFGPVPLAEAAGKILAHNIAGPDGARLLNKGRPLNDADIAALHNHGFTQVYAAWLEPGDVDENDAALQTAQAVTGHHIDLSRAAVGRVSLRAAVPGVVRVDASRLNAMNQVDGITLATLASGVVVKQRQMVGTVKIIPYGIPQQAIDHVVSIASGGDPIIHVDALNEHNVALVFFGSQANREKLISDFSALADRVTGLGSHVASTDFIEQHENGIEQQVAETLSRVKQSGISLILVAGETAIMHRNDMIPRAVEQAGGLIECVGAPVDPGNLLMLAYLGDVPVLGAPSCARSPKANVVDQVIPRLLVGEHLTRSDIIALAYGGLLTD